MEHKKQVVDHLADTFLSFLGTGFIPVAPGTFGSLASIPFLYYFYPLIPINFYTFFILILLIISVYIANYRLKKTKQKDPGWIVIDEVLGMMVAWPSLKSFGIIEIATLLALFRFFDIVKIWPASYYDKKDSALGVMMDDIVSGIYVTIVMLALQQWTNFPGIW